MGRFLQVLEVLRWCSSRVAAQSGQALWPFKSQIPGSNPGRSTFSQDFDPLGNRGKLFSKQRTANTFDDPLESELPRQLLHSVRSWRAPGQLESLAHPGVFLSYGSIASNRSSLPSTLTLLHLEWFLQSSWRHHTNNPSDRLSCICNGLVPRI